MNKREFSINRIMQPGLSLTAFIRLAADAGANGVEIRNDLDDPSLLGGLIVKIGSRQVDTSLRTKLSTLKHTLKEVG